MQPNQALLKQIPGLTLEIKRAFKLAFRYVWIAGLVASIMALCGNFCTLILLLTTTDHITLASALLIDPKSEFNAHIDAPMNKVFQNVQENEEE